MIPGTNICPEFDEDKYANSHCLEDGAIADPEACRAANHTWEDLTCGAYLARMEEAEQAAVRPEWYGHVVMQLKLLCCDGPGIPASPGRG